VASSNDNAIVHLDRELPPICHGTAAAGPAGAPVTVPLECSDPNGDPLEVSIESGPAHGSLSAIDQASTSVGYTPDPGFVGSDYFSVRATADGNQSQLTTAVIQVGAPGAAGPRARPDPQARPDPRARPVP
jgi:Big-like domain-containing protein